jgi:hypothetical protein
MPDENPMIQFSPAVIRPISRPHPVPIRLMTLPPLPPLRRRHIFRSARLARRRFLTALYLRAARSRAAAGASLDRIQFAESFRSDFPIGAAPERAC